ncbi:RNA-binding protein lark [Alosa sapidissima]|uniref:RNA-binding protein lark n=1 Tax=Alosa sapidissima TaxID=34773 RepID=UPI001C0A4614|nr:RNA-binding protein lark [Alosa sapidissima]XP_041948577.1 RNA-binding protein lark [Alosa sapidissima]XP_041948578.1 RNA-binding protein lark [Alosa sapidissima]XP_041948579.1 RNA-binding protein lark [Alosa sapidissima]XP_041948580.1 RNA-binding protein lark [Alosa sapidissima]XP_041948581.1 RNA-binding protein lark [Alosa sapidissima]XP_041948582.1 RNA-binding protein lark [Alosa sapidissima]XP_041948583.1 RNA-binding protein lark [Alosa sapidissima]XP_041948584.1 RNA-binding protein 
MVKVFVGNVSTSTTEEELRELFEKYGAVIDCDIISNYGFVHMSEEEDAKKAVAALNKHKLHGFSMTVQFATTRVRNATKIHVGNLPEGVTALKIRELFQEFGKVLECDVLKKYAFVHMQRHKEAAEAIEKLNHSRLEGQTIFVSLSHTNPGKRAPDQFPEHHYPPGPPRPYPPPGDPMRPYPPLRNRPLNHPLPPPPGRLRPPPLPPPHPMRMRPPRSVYDDPYDYHAPPPPPPPSLYERPPAPSRHEPVRVAPRAPPAAPSPASAPVPGPQPPPAHARPAHAVRTPPRSPAAALCHRRLRPP